jgi:hypothetical protein
MYIVRCGYACRQKGHRKVTQKEAENGNKYEYVIELELVWYMKCQIIPVVTGAIGTATKGLKKNWKPYEENIQ